MMSDSIICAARGTLNVLTWTEPFELALDKEEGKHGIRTLTHAAS